QGGYREPDRGPDVERLGQPLAHLSEADARGYGELARHQPARRRAIVLMGVARAGGGAPLAKPRHLLVVHVELSASRQRILERGDEPGIFLLGAEAVAAVPAPAEGP